MTHDIDIAGCHRQPQGQSAHNTRVEFVQQLKNARLSESFSVVHTGIIPCEDPQVVRSGIGKV